MTPNTPSKLSPKLLNQVILVLILIAVVIGLVLTVLALPGFNIPAAPTPALTLTGAPGTTPDAAQLTEVAAAAVSPVVRVEGIVVTGCILVLIVLAATLREILRLSRRS